MFLAKLGRCVIASYESRADCLPSEPLLVTEASTSRPRFSADHTGFGFTLTGEGLSSSFEASFAAVAADRVKSGQVDDCAT